MSPETPFRRIKTRVVGKFEGSHDFGLQLHEEVLDRKKVANYMSSKPALSILAPALSISNWLTTSPVSLREA
jgi:hypothetical protein